MTLDQSYPAIADLRARARRRLPHFAFEYLDSGTGTEAGLHANRAALDAVKFMPAILRGGLEYDTKQAFMGDTYDLPIGIAPVGFSGMIWPGAERILARVACDHNIPYCQSTVAAAAPEDVADQIGQNGWFQHYPVNSAEVRRDMLRRIADAGFRKLVVTVDVPGESRRERQRRALISMPPQMRPSILWSMAASPAWALGMARAGVPRMRFMESYSRASGRDAFVHAGRMIRGWPDADYIRALRDEWRGDFIVKGVLDPDDVPRLRELGADAIWVSNHSGRQFEAGPAAIDQLPLIRAAAGPDFPLIFDSGVAGGLDVLRALALGADFVLLGRAFHYGLGAFGARGAAHVVHILAEDMKANMAQIGAGRLEEVASRVIE